MKTKRHIKHLMVGYYMFGTLTTLCIFLLITILDTIINKMWVDLIIFVGALIFIGYLTFKLGYSLKSGYNYMIEVN